MPNGGGSPQLTSECFILTSKALLRGIVLGSAASITAIAPAIAADTSRADAKRMLALYGHRAVAHGNTAAKAAPVSKDPMYTDLYKFKGGVSPARRARGEGAQSVERTPGLGP